MKEMKEMKRKTFLSAIGALAVATLFAAVCAGSAAATVLCKNNLSTTACSQRYGAGIEVTLALTGSMTQESTGGTVFLTCTGTTIKGKTASAGSSTETVKVPIESLTWAGCVTETKMIVNGEMEFHHVSGTDNATLTWRNTQITVNGIFNNESCIYGPGSGTDLGTISGGAPATVGVSVLISRQPGSGPFCTAETRWTMSLQISQPTPLYFSAG